ncbi:hypothetical protein BFP72_01320 [Reichenbachiella sp. 5M10]|uniref:ATP-binding protein n=1 Tax=Reichenbachiella sp. 5M10 TaxID=1889772 RepID=UPI000C14DBE3|nr:tetratricopeptide repeat protein [Reichenbachiella sp. 5M10]PIB34163.1 hypothetical protein BFP72_01320 [Reichenbachiella sp. 5M10]
MQQKRKKVMIMTGVLWVCHLLLCAKPPVVEDSLVRAQVNLLLDQSQNVKLSLDSTVLLLEEAQALSQEGTYRYGIGLSSYFLGVAQLNTGKYDEAERNIVRAREVLSQLGEDYYVMLSYKQQGSIHRARGNAAESIEYATTALGLSEALGLPEESLKIMNNIGAVHLGQGHFELAKAQFRNSLALNPEDRIRAILLGNLGLAEEKDGNHDKALEYYQESLDISMRLGDPVSQYTTMDFMSALFLQKGEYDKALAYSYQTMKAYERDNRAPELLKAYNRIGLIHAQVNHYDSADYYYHLSLEIAQALGSVDVMYIYANLAFNHAHQGEYKKAYEELNIHTTMKDSVLTLEKSWQVEELLAKYESASKEKEISILQAEQALHEASLERQRLIRNTAMGGSLLMLGVSVLLIYSYAQKLKNNKVLAQKNEEINRQTLREILKENVIVNIKATIKGQEEERMRIAKELHDSVAGSLAAVKLRLENLTLDKSGEEAVKPIVEQVNQTYEEVRTLSHNLTPTKVLNAPFVELIKSYVEELAQSTGLEICFLSSQCEVLNELPDSFKVDVYRIIQELLANAVKHAQAKYIEVVLTKNEEEINLLVEDNGRGFEVSRSSKGIGFENIKHRIKVLNGQMNIDSTLGRGTIVNIDLPWPNEGVDAMHNL